MGHSDARYNFVVVAHRLPVDEFVDTDGGQEWRRSPGGAAAVLRDVVATQAGVWVGWPGSGVSSSNATVDPFVHDGMPLYPVSLTVEEVEEHYEGFCNSTIWPLYHDAVERPVYRQAWWQAYLRVNRRFADAAARVAAEGALVWVHDYQLQLVPAMLREQRPDLRIGFFLHIPMPAREMFMQLPWRAEVMRGLLGADLVGFQQHLAATNFLQLTRFLLGLRPYTDRVELDGRAVTAGAFPISIDMSAAEQMAARPSVSARAREIRVALGSPRTVLLGIDRLDYTKGIEQRLGAYGELIEEGRLSREDTVFVQIAPPSRERASRYRDLRERVERLTGHLNGEYGWVGQSVVYCLHQPYDVLEAAALYQVADVMVVTPFRDGMNLIAKEYVASRVDNSGALVLSEFAGAASELRQAFLVNPHHIDSLKEAIVRAAYADPVEKSRRMRVMRRHLRSHDVHAWTKSFLTALEATRRPS